MVLFPILLLDTNKNLDIIFKTNMTLKGGEAKAAQPGSPEWEGVQRMTQ